MQFLLPKITKIVNTIWVDKGREPMEITEIEISLPCSLAGRNVNRVVQNVNKLKSNVYLTKNERVVNMKSILGILSVGCNQGDKVKIACLNKEKSEADEDMNIVKQILESGGM